jgi:transposase
MFQKGIMSKYAYLHAKVEKEAVRRSALKAVLDGNTQTEVAKLFGVSRQTLSKWVKAYRENGEEGLKSRPRGRPKGASIHPLQAMQIAKLVADCYPDELDLPFYLWSREAVAYLIEQRYGVRFSISTVGRYLERWGFVARKPLCSTLKKCSVITCLRLDQECRNIRRQVKKEKSVIYWGDVSGLRPDHSWLRGYAHSDQRSLISVTGQFFGYNMILGITNKGQLNFLVFKGRSNSEVFLEFLRRLIRERKRKVVLIMDSGHVYAAKEIITWLGKYVDQIRLVFLTETCPWLHLDDAVNREALG